MFPWAPSSSRLVTACVALGVFLVAGGCANTVELTESTASTPGSLQGHTLRYESSVIDAGRTYQAAQTAAVVSAMQWQIVREQEGQFTCEARIGEVRWLVSGQSCENGTLMTVYSVDDDSSSVFQIGNEMSPGHNWSSGPMVEEVAPADSPVAGPPTDDIQAYRLQGHGFVADWVLGSEHDYPLAYRLAYDDGQEITHELMSSSEETMEMLNSPPDWVVGELSSQERMADENTEAPLVNPDP